MMARRDWPLAGAGLLFAASLLLFWPGIADYDSVFQFEQLASGEFTDWHPPIMARWWGVLHTLFGGSGQPLLVFDMALYWLGLGLLGAALARSGRRAAAAAMLAIGCWPPFLGWQAHLLKDAGMAGSAVAAVGIIGWHRLQRRRPPVWAWSVAGVLLLYAVLVRANAAFALMPMAAMLVPWRWPARAVTAGVGVLAAIALSGPINHRLLGAEPSGVEATQAMYDLAGIAVRSGGVDTPFTPDAVATMRARRCVKPFFWDPLGEQCDALMAPLRAQSAGRLYAALAVAALRHPLAYAGHRLAHWNSTERWLVPARWPSAAPPAGSEPNDDGLASPGHWAERFERFAGWCLETPLGWPVVGAAAALAAALTARRRPADPARDLALALLVSALALEASFLFLSIASDWRYHLWPMLAEAVGLVLLGRPRRAERRAATIAGLVLLAAIVAGVAVRAVLPAAPPTYAGMLSA